MHVVVVIFVVIIGLSSSHHHIASPIITRPRVHTDNNIGPEGARALLPALQAMTGLQILLLDSTLPPPTRWRRVRVCLRVVSLSVSLSIYLSLSLSFSLCVCSDDGDNVHVCMRIKS